MRRDGRRAAALAGVLVALAGGARAADVPVRCADHGGHFRLVFDLPSTRALAAYRADGTVELDWPAAWQPAFDAGCQGSQRLRRWRRADGRLVLVLGGEMGARAFRLSEPPRWVVDLGRVDGDLPRRAPLPPLVQPPAPLPFLVPEAPPEILARARARADDGDIEGAVALLREQGKPGEQPAAVQFELGRLQANQGRHLAAAQRLWRAASQHPDHPAAPGALERAARLFDGMGFHYQATRPLEAYLRTYPLDPRAQTVQLELGRLYALADELGAAREELIPLTYEGAGDLAVRAHYWLTYLLARGGDFGAARSEFARLMERDRDYVQSHPELLFATARSFLETGEPATAKDMLATFLREHPDHPRHSEALVLQGRAYMAMDDWRRAQARFREVLDASPQADLEARARAGLTRTGYALDRIGLERGVARLEEIARGLPGSRAATEARMLAAQMLAEADQGGAALAQLRPILERGDEIAKRQARPLVDRLLPAEMAAALEADEPFRAFRLFNRFAGDRPSGTVRDRAFQALLRLGALQGARRLLAATRRDQGGTVQIQRWQWLLGRAFRRTGAAVGVGWIERVLADHPDHPRARALRLEKARLLSRLGRHDELLSYLNRQPRLPRRDTVPLRARALKARGELAPAFRVLDRYASGDGRSLPGPVLAEAGDLAARLDRVYRARHYWVAALEAGVPPWERLQLQALLGVGAVQREDFEGARAFLEGLPADDEFGRAARLYASLIPVIRERLQ